MARPFTTTSNRQVWRTCMARRTHGITRIFEKAAEAIARILIPQSRRPDLWELADKHPPDYAYQLLDSTVRAMIDGAKRIAYPAIVIDRGSPEPLEKRQRLNDLPEGLRQSVVMFLIAALAYISWA